jgi:hypothetical protein
MERPTPPKKFLPLGASAKIPIQRRLPAAASMGSPSPGLTASFVAPDLPPPAHPVRLPDIYTTCPELLHFQPLYETAPLKDLPTSSFDPSNPNIRPYFSAGGRVLPLQTS